MALKCIVRGQIYTNPKLRFIAYLPSPLKHLATPHFVTNNFLVVYTHLRVSTVPDCWEQTLLLVVSLFTPLLQSET